MDIDYCVHLLYSNYVFCLFILEDTNRVPYPTKIIHDSQHNNKNTIYTQIFISVFFDINIDFTYKLLVLHFTSTV